MTRTDLINFFLKGKGSFLEIGYYDGKNHSKIKCDEKLAVDPKPLVILPNHFVVRTTSDKYFKEAIAKELKYDLIFIDGLHHADQVERDIDNALKCLTKGGYILVHDVLPTKEEHTLVPRPTPSGHWNGDVYKAWIKLRSRSDVNMYVIDTDNGVGVIQKGQQKPKKIEPVFKNITTKNMNRISLEDWKNDILPLDV